MKKVIIILAAFVVTIQVKAQAVMNLTNRQQALVAISANEANNSHIRSLMQMYLTSKIC